MRIYRIFVVLLAALLLCAPVLNAQCATQCGAMELSSMQHTHAGQSAMHAMPCCPVSKSNAPAVAASNLSNHATHSDVDMITDEAKLLLLQTAVADVPQLSNEILPLTHAQHVTKESPPLRTAAVVSLQSILRI